MTFLLTDVEGSTRLWETRPGDMPAAIARHYEILDAVATAHRGVRPVEQGEGDSVVAAFASARDAIAAAVAAQMTLQRELPWLAVRMAVHTGGAQLRGNDNYMGRSIIRCARLRACGHGGQILVSETTASLVADELHDEGALVDLGTARLRDLHRSERVWQVVHSALRALLPAPSCSLFVIVSDVSWLLQLATLSPCQLSPFASAATTSTSGSSGPPAARVSPCRRSPNDSSTKDSGWTAIR